MIVIHAFEANAHFIAGEEGLNYGTWGFPREKRDRDARFQRGDARFGKVCPSHSCGRCTVRDCFYVDFIRNRWKHPQGD